MTLVLSRASAATLSGRARSGTGVVAFSNRVGDRLLRAINRAHRRVRRCSRAAVLRARPTSRGCTTSRPTGRTIRRELDDVLAYHADLPELPGHLHRPVRRSPTTTGGRPTSSTATASRASRTARAAPRPPRLVESIPGMETAMFSILSPGKHIPPHTGPYKGVLRYHLGLLDPRAGGAARHHASAGRPRTGRRARASSSTTPSSTRRGTTPTRRGSCCSSTSCARCAGR